MNKNVLISQLNVNVLFGEWNITFGKKPNSEGLYTAQANFPFSPQMVEIIESSHILKIDVCNSTGGLIYRGLDFYSTEKAIEVFIDLLEKIQPQS